MTFDNFINENLVSIIIPLYNKENTIINSVKTLVNQTYKNIEIIIVDDSSTDSSVNLLNSYIKDNNFENIFIFKTSFNLGCYYARNLGISKSNGKYIAFQDPDDYSDKNRIKIQMYDIYSKKVSISLCNIYRFNHIHPNIYNLKNLIDLDRKGKNIKQFNYKFKLGIVTSIIEKKLFKKYGLYANERHSQDLEIIERFFCIIMNKNPFDLDNFHSYIINNPITKVYFYNKENVYYVSDIMNNTNITNIYKKKEIKEMIIKWKFNILNLKNFYNK
jgi:glycosyltransferase involved in cell wall biosynthesis